MKSIFQGVFIIGFSIALTACADFYESYPAVTVDNSPPPAAANMHYGPAPDASPAASGMHYGPSSGPSYPSVTVSDGGEPAANGMHYG